MSLEEYVRKRSFDKTPEPKPGKAAKASQQPRFYVQRHDATRLHYDFRLEIGGTLVSWAVPKGPSLEPLAKHLAMHVEDHPLEYGTFEGNIPKGQYGGGSVMLWDRGTWELLGDASASDQIKRGDFKFRLHGEKLKGEFALVLMRGRGKGNEWLIIKKKDDEARPGWNIEDYARSVSTGRTQQEIAEDLPAVEEQAKIKRRRMPKGAVKGPMPATLEPMMACLTDNPPKGQDWLYEVKWDGIRALCFVEDGELRILSRSGNRCERQYPELTVLPHHVKAASAILDGEIAVLDAKGRSSFSLIQPRISVADPNSIAHLSRSSPVTLFLFDLLYLDGYDLRGVPLEERKALLAEVVEIDEGIRMSDHFVAQGDAMLEAARANGLEGIIGKRRESLYESRRSPNWLKIKVNTEQEFVIGGFTHGERDYFSSLALGLYDKGKFVHVGQVGTGFNDKSLRDIHGKLEPLIIPKSPFAAAGKIPRKVTWVKPELVCNVKYLEFTPDNQLRAPVFLGLRADKDPKECVREVAEPVEKVVQEARTGALLPNDSPNDVALTIDGQALKFTNLNKVFWPGEKITKRDLINYYDAVADLILPHLHDRPLSLKRYPNGIDKPFFFQKNAEQFPDWVRLEPIHSEHSSRDIHYTICNDRATLLFLANLACIDQNPWMSRLSHLENPDFALIDLDPTEGCPYHQIVEAAQLVRAKLELIGLEGCPKTTGGDGMHIYIPLKPVYSYDQVRSFAEILSMLVIHEDPALFTTPRAVSARKKGKVYFDYLQIAASKTISAPYVVRAYPGAPVSTPLAWNEVKKGLEPGDFTIRNAPARFAKKGDVFGGVLANPQRLEAALEKLAGLVAG